VYALITSFYCSNNGTNDVSSLNDSVKQYCGIHRFDASNKSLYGSFAFNTVYLIEVIIRLVAVGPLRYFSKLRNFIDFSVIVVSFIALCFETLCDTNSDARIFFCYLVVIRPIKLFRILQVRKRYYNIMNTMFTLFHRLLSVCLVLFVMYYFFAIIGMEVFSGKLFVGCCENALFNIGDMYSSDGRDPSSTKVYWLNNFDNIYQSYSME
jgi:two pore calcium channel protein 1